MTTLQDQPQVAEESRTISYGSDRLNKAVSQQGDRSHSSQAQQESQSSSAERNQSGDDGHTFTVSTDDWY